MSQDIVKFLFKVSFIRQLQVVFMKRLFANIKDELKYIIFLAIAELFALNVIISNIHSYIILLIDDSSNAI